MSSHRAECIILRNRLLGERDVLVTAFSREKGKIRAVARAAKQSKSKLNGVVQPFDHVMLELFSGRSLDGIRGGEVLESFQGLRDDLDHISYASVMSELVDSMAQDEDRDEAVFWLTLTCFRALNRGMSRDLVLSFFLVRLIKSAGLLPDFTRCQQCGRSLSDGATFLLHHSAFHCRDCRPGDYRLSPESMKRLVWLREVHPNTLFRGEEDFRGEGNLRNMLLDYVQRHLDRPLNSRSFLDILSNEG